MYPKIYFFIPVLLGIFLFTGCSPKNEPPADAYHGQIIPKIITFQGRVYSSTGETILQTPVGTPDTTGTVQFLGSVLSEGETYEVYSFRDVDPVTAIAVKRLLANTEGGSDFYFKYVVE
ncbi:hypothetical protein Dehly_0492 [Dehalogenimonas lykanthroporepellens BL-DC-9]|nr:hypothetical protein Dehly_0492 [Dehalogenimonas lykanthroporepellens BL-DC-9]